MYDLIPTVGFRDQLLVVHSFGCQDMRQAVEELVTLLIGRKTLDAQLRIALEAPWILLDARAVEWPAVDQHQRSGCREPL